MCAGQVGEIEARARAYGEAWMARFEMPGLQIAFTDRSGLLGHLELGYANLDARLPVTPETLFECGSIGKSFTAICLLQLEAEGLVDFHAPFETQLPWWSIRSAFEPITIHHLLSHTAGIVTGTDFTPEQRFEVWSMRKTETTSPPGTRFHYSNVGYKALGLLIEHVTGKPYGRVVSERIFKPLGMTNAIGAISQGERHRLAIGYQPYFDDRPRLAGHGVAPAPWLETDSGDGCLCASASDLATYLRMLLNRGAYEGGRILTEEQFRRMTEARIVTRPEADRAYGYGMSIPASRPPGVFGHSGGMVGFISQMIADLDMGVGAVAFTNSMNEVASVADYALALATAAIRDQALPDPPALPEGDYSGVAGTYHGPSGTVIIRDEAGGFALERDGERAILFKTPERNGTLVDDRPGQELVPYRFSRDDAGAVTSVVHGSEEWNADPSSMPATPLPELERLAGHYRSNNPWQSNFRIVARGSSLYRIMPDGDEKILTPLADGYVVDSDEEGPERIWIDVHVDGVVAEVRDQLGSTWHRTFTP